MAGPNGTSINIAPPYSTECVDRFNPTLNKLIKAEGPKGIQSQTQGESLRVSGKKRDDLQATMALLKGSDIGIPLQFNNFRD